MKITKFIKFDFDEVKAILCKKDKRFENITEKGIMDILPSKFDMDTLNKFYNETGLNVFFYFNDLNNERTLFFNKLGAYPEFDEASGNYLFASGEYFKHDKDIRLKADIIIEENVQLLSQTNDAKNYIIVPLGKENYLSNIEDFYIPIEYNFN